MCADLDLSVNLVRENCSLFNREWAYLHRSLSGKYRVSRITVTTTEFDELKSIRTGTYPDGVYIYLGKRIRVDLIEADPDLSDFYVVNGNFDGTHYELLSYHTGNKIEGDGSRYLIPASELPPSETPGIGVLDVQGRTFGNIPPLQRGYIHRPVLEAELHTHLTNDRHSIVTLVGRGGIGKTSLALSVLNHIAK